jgi:predicted esterase
MEQQPSPQAADQEVIDINSDTVRLETQCENGSWKDVGPINLLNNMNTKTVHTNSSSSSSSRRKELSPTTKQILGHTANSFMFRHSHDGIDENLVIFLHGAGDNHIPFDKLGQTMKLPQTATLSLSASMKMNLPDSSQSKSSNSTFVELPFGLGYTWFEEMDYQVTGDVLPNDHPRRLQSLSHAVLAMNALLSSLTDHSSNESSYWIPERIFLFGFSAGACLAMEICRLWKLRRNVPLGGAICIGGGIKSESLPGCVAVNYNGDDDQHKFTDVLIITGSKDTVYSQKMAAQTTSIYDGSKVQTHVQQGKGHGMIGSREEMQTVMEFLSKRLVRRMSSMEDMSEK